MKNILHFDNREQFSSWLMEHAEKREECWLNCLRKKPDSFSFTYLDAVEEALCFGYIDSVYKQVDGIYYQRFSPRKKNSPWTELNKERARRLIKLKLMTPLGKKVLPSMRYKEDKDVADALKKARVYSKFKKFPPLYQRVRIYNIAFYKRKNKSIYNAALNHLIDKTKQGEMYGEWNDYGRLIDY